MKSEQIFRKRDTMVVLDVRLDNFYAFKNFHINFTYPKKIVASSIKEEHLPDRPNFRYKKVNVLLGANASGKTTFGRVLMKIFNFIDKKNSDYITAVIGERDKEASFTMDLASENNVFYRVICVITPCEGEKYGIENVKLEIREENIGSRDSYEVCVKRLENKPFSPANNYIEELEKIEELSWLFRYPDEGNRILTLPDKDERFRVVLENILMSLDPAIKKVKISQDADKAYVVQLQDKSVILQNGERFKNELLSSGTRAGVEVAEFIFSLIEGLNSFLYCDEKFSYIHSDVEKAVLSLMIELLGPHNQLFFTTHNTDILDINLPKHAFTFLRKDVDDANQPITCIEASSLLKRNTDSLKNAVENDLFSTSPAVERIYAIADMDNEE